MENEMIKANKYFNENLNEILTNGYSTEGYKVRPRWKDGTPAHTKYINQVVEKYDISIGEYPISTYRPLAWKSAIKEIIWIYSEQSNDLDLLEEKYGIHWWNEWQVDNTRTIGQRYGATIRKYDLMNKLLDGLIKEPYTRRHIINMYQYADFEETQGLYPCAYETTWNVRGEYLDMTLHQRSNDFLVAGCINKIQYVALLMMVARHVGLKCGTFMHIVENLHVYDRHIENAKIMLNTPTTDIQPKLILKEGKTNFYDFTIDDFELIDFETQGESLKFELAI
jgi:thymidylate synthase